MAVFNTIRAGRKKEGYMENLIHNMYTDERVLFRQGYGVLDETEEKVVYSFYSVRNAYYKINQIKVHYMEIYVEYEFKLVDVVELAKNLAYCLYKYGFQTLVACIDTGNGYMIAVAVNAVSYVDGRLFHDNNAQYWAIYQYLRSCAPIGLSLTASENTFFPPRMENNNYVHGTLS